MSARYWEAEEDPDDPTEIALTNPEGRYVYGFLKADARGIRDALNELSEAELEEGGGEVTAKEADE